MTTATKHKIYTLTLPWPPSINGYWRAIVRGSGRRAYQAQILSERGRAYRGSVDLASTVSGLKRMQLSGRIGVTVCLNPPSRRRSDLDNFTKGIFDGLTHAGVWLDDSQVDELTVTRGPIIKGGQAVVTLWEMGL